MKQKKNQHRDHQMKPQEEPGEETPGVVERDPLKQAYEAPRIVSSKIFHKVMLSTPQPGFPGCTIY
jgi:hypothetical protein